MSREKIQAQRKQNEETAKLIASLTGVTGDKPTTIKPTKRKNRKKKKSTSAILEEVGNLFAKSGPTGSEVQSLEDYVSGYGNPIGAGPADVSFGPHHEGAGYSVFKKGGRLKKTKVKKRAALRGQRSELRGS